MSLEPIRNQVRPARARQKVYGRKRVVPLEIQNDTLQLFGGTNENALAQSLEKLDLSTCTEEVVASDSASKSQLQRDTSSSSPNESCTKSTNQIEVPVPRPPRSHNSKIQAKAHDRPKKPTKPKPGSKLKNATLTTIERATLSSVLAHPWVDATVVDFEQFGGQLAAKFEVTKLNEGSYSDCFVARQREDQVEVGVFKIMPIALEAGNTSPSATSPEGFLREVEILSALHPYHGFAQIFTSRLVRGPMHQRLVNAARTWLDETEDEDADKTIDPATRYPDDQIYGIIEMAYAGRDLELLHKPSAFQAYDAFWQTVMLLANAEVEIEFEHRDLHMSNICFKPGESGRVNVDNDTIKDLGGMSEMILGLSDLEISIIDYTHSRMKDSATAAMSFNPEPALTGIELEELGIDRTPCDQIDTIIKAEKCMSRFFNDNPGRLSKYEAFTPRTNVIWLSHVLSELTNHARKLKRWPTISQSCPGGRSLQIELWKKMDATLRCIGSTEVENIPDSANMLVRKGVDEGWISLKDVEAFKSRLNKNAE